jgi:hypothetical protein
LEIGWSEAHKWVMLLPDRWKNRKQNHRPFRCRVRSPRRPSLEFDPSLYLLHYPDVAPSGLYPLLPYIQNGQAEGRLGCDSGLSRAELAVAMRQIRDRSLFDDKYHLNQCPDLREARVNAPLPYLVSGFGPC